jgi:serine/threonine protein kinase
MFDLTMQENIRQMFLEQSQKIAKQSQKEAKLLQKLAIASLMTTINNRVIDTTQVRLFEWQISLKFYPVFVKAAVRVRWWGQTQTLALSWRQTTFSIDARAPRRKYASSYLSHDRRSTNIPSEYEVLLQLIQKPRMDVFGPTVDAKGDILGRLLGTGSALLVFQHLTKPSWAVKVSRYGVTRDIKNEVSILKKLNEQASHSHIPTFFEYLDLEVSFGDLKRKLPACSIGPVGTGLLRVCSETKESEKYSWLLLVLNNLQSALTFMHERHIFHRDVNPKNVIIVPDSGSAPRAVLIDSSIAFHDENPLVSRGFCGTINYSHRELLSFSPAVEFKPVAGHDLASLGFTMSTLVNGGNVPWRSVVAFPKSTLTNSDRALFAATMEERFEKAGKLAKIETYKKAQEGGNSLSQDRNV